MAHARKLQGRSPQQLWVTLFITVLPPAAASTTVFIGRTQSSLSVNKLAVGQKSSRNQVTMSLPAFHVERWVV